MEKTTTQYVFHILLVCVPLVVDVLANTIVTAAASDGDMNYVKASCCTTTYPALCNRYLSPYASDVGSDPWNLREVALSVSIQAASNASALITWISKRKGLSEPEASIVEDCFETIGSSIDEMNRSLQTIRRMVNSSEGKDKDFQMSNVKTWVSAAITDENTCTDGFDERGLRSNVSKAIRKSMGKVTRLTSNALSLVNSLRY